MFTTKIRSNSFASDFVFNGRLYFYFVFKEFFYALLRDLRF